MVTATNLGFPRIGAKRELKKATESYWAGKISADELFAAGAEIRAHNWKLQKAAGIAHIPSNDFSFYDQVLDMIATVGAVPARYDWSGETVDLDTYFAMARGSDTAIAMEMTKWFDTNYHYIVPELHRDTTFKLSSSKAVDQYKEAKALGIETRPVLIGPISFLKLAKTKDGEWNPLSLLDELLPVYSALITELKDAGAEWIQMDEPVLVLDQDEETREKLAVAYEELAAIGPKLIVATYFEALRENLDSTLNLPVAAIHLDLVRAPEQLDDALELIPADKILSLGVIDGRNIWRADLSKALDTVEKAVEKLGQDRVFVAGSCSLIHTPVDLDSETKLDDELKNWMAFATQKVAEIATIAKGATDGRGAIADELAASDAAVKSRSTSSRIHNPAVKDRVKNVTPDMLQRKSAFLDRAKKQHAALNLPAFPTTTIGSFPQTPEIRKSRAAFKRGDLDAATYEAEMKAEIQRVVDFQEKAGLDVLVHGEPERNDMVEYFGEQMDGYTFTKFGWVQSYGSRYVKPPIIFGDVSRPTPMTVEWTKYAQTLTNKPMKGMLTGPITMLQWSFVRDDQPRSETANQIALALLDEVQDLEAAGIGVIQMDEPAIREGLPLRKADWAAYLKWAVEAFRLSTVGVNDETQIHTHMCYSDFNDIISSIGDMDADVISIETSRSQMELLDCFKQYKYPNEIGPGVYDIHSPRIPSEAEMVDLLKKAVALLKPEQIWVNPDCGLKTRKWEEVEPALIHMVNAARAMRKVAKAA